MLVLSGAGSVHHLVPGCDYKIGRKTDADIVVEADVQYGVSRYHGALSYHINGELLYTDTSQYGSFVNSNKINKNESVALQAGSEVKLGHHPTVWKLEPMKVAISNLQGSEKREVVAAVKRLDIPFSGQWDKTCTCLIMSKISSTVKVIKAVAHCRHILTPAFVKDLDLAIRNRTKLSSLKKYVPPADPTLQTAKFYPIPARKTLFEPLQFVFMSVGEKKESEQLVKDLGGTVALLDPLCPKRRNVILSEESIVMDTKDLAVSEYVKTILLERGLVPTSPNDLILSLLYNDKAKLFKRSSDTQSTQSAQIRVQDTQNFSQMTCTVQDIQPVSNRSCDESTIEASAVPPRLDRTIHSSLKSVQKNSIKVESCASTVKPEMLSEPDEVSRNGAKKAVSSPDLSLSKTRQDISFCEASAVPPKLDKTIKTPLASPFSTKQEVTFIEPSVVPPKLDKTIKSPVSSIVASTEKISNTSAIEPSHFVSPLGQNPLFNKSAALVSPGASSETNRRIDVTTPTRTSIGSDVSLFDNSRSTSFVGISTPSGSVTSKPPLMNSGKSASSSRKKRPFSLESSDSDEDSGDDNPFAKSKTKSTFFTVSSASKNSKSLASHNVSKKPKMDASNNSADNFMCRESESEGKSASDSGTADPESSGRVCESPSSSPRVSSNQLQTSDNQFVGNEEIPSSASQTQSVKRELHEKTESATKKLKTVDNSVSLITTTLSNITIPDTSQSVWIKRPDTNAELERSFSSYVVTDISADLIKESRDSFETHLQSVEGGAQSVVNFKRFKKKGVITRSMDVTLTNGQFRSNTTSIFDASQSQQSVEEDEEEPSIFSDRFAGSRRAIF